MKFIASSVAACLLSISLAAQTAEHPTVPLWQGETPGEKGTAEEDKPAITIYEASAEKRVPTAVVVCPGGGYVHLAMDHEGKQIAAWLNNLGISALVLKYRLGPKYHYPVELSDAQRAIRYLRAHAGELGVQTDRVGIWGFSAGGHLASTAGTHFDEGDSKAPDEIDRQSSRPDFMILAYPVITMEEPFVHRGSRQALLGDHPDQKLIQLLSNEKQVTTRTPPTFLFHTSDDAVVPVENSVNFYLALRRAGVPAEMHIYLKGKHGVGLAQDDPVLRTWPDRLADWLRVQGLR